MTVLGSLYLRGRNGELRKLPKPLSDYMQRQLAHRNRTLQKFWMALAALIGAILIVFGGSFIELLTR